MPKLDAGGVANVAAAIVFVVVVVDSLAVFLRMLAKSRTKYYFSNDDYWILAALLCFFAWAGPILYGEYPTIALDLYTSDLLSHIWPRRLSGCSHSHGRWRRPASAQGLAPLARCSCGNR